MGRTIEPAAHFNFSDVFYKLYEWEILVKTNTKVMAALAVLMLSACGGGASDPGGSESLTRDGLVAVPLDSARIVESFADGSVWRTKYSPFGQSDGSTGAVIGPALTGAQTSSITPTSIDWENLVIVGTNEHGTFYEGVVGTTEGAENGTIFIDDSGELLIIDYQNLSTNNLSAFGIAPENIPLSGSATYEGTNIFTLRDGSYAETGTFVMTINFAAPTGSLQGQTANTNIVVDEIAFDLQNGQFYSNLAMLTVDGNEVSASLYGSIHGDGGTGVTGIYHENSAIAPLFAGAIAGGLQ
jgi:hypothetical protein